MKVEYFVRMEDGWNCQTTITNSQAKNYVRCEGGYKKLTFQGEPYILKAYDDPGLFLEFYGKKQLRYAYFFPCLPSTNAEYVVVPYTEYKSLKAQGVEFIYIPLCHNDRIKMENMRRDDTNFRYSIYCHKNECVIQESIDYSVIVERRKVMRDMRRLAQEKVNNAKLIAAR